MISGSNTTLIVAVTVGAIVVVGILTATLVFGIKFCKARKSKQTTKEHPYENQPSVPSSEPNVPGDDENKDPPAKLSASGIPDSKPVDLAYENHGYSNGQYDCVDIADISTDINMYDAVKVAQKSEDCELDTKI